MSKFEYGAFLGDEYRIAVSKERFTEEQAIEIAKSELMTEDVECEAGEFWVYYGFCTNDDGEKCTNWWLTERKPKKGCPVWAFKAGG